MLFLTEIVGSEVIDLAQRRLGRVRDLTVRAQEPYPVVTGLVVSRRRELIVPWACVRTFAASEVALRVPREEVEKAPADPGDVWLARDILDKQIIDTDGRRVVRVNDLQLTQTSSAMLLVGADIGLRGILRRLGLESMGKGLMRILGRELPMVLVSWNAVDSISQLSEPPPAGGDRNGALQLRISGRRIAKLHPADIADIVEELGARDRRALFATLSEEIAADTLEEMELEDQVSVVEHMDSKRASEIIEEMSPDEVADLLSDLPEAKAREILTLMGPERATHIRELLAFAEDTAGGLMTTEYVAVTDTLTAEGCIDTLRRLEPKAESIYYVYVVDDEDHLVGVLSLRDLIVAGPRTPISEMLTRDVVTVRVDTPRPEVAAVLSKYNLLAVPVIDDHFRMRGIVTIDDALESVLPEAVRRRLPRVH